MGHEWKIGDWCEFGGVRCLVIDNNAPDGDLIIAPRYASRFFVDDHHTTLHYPPKDHPKLTRLPDCTSWDWQPPKPIEPPDGYRLLTTGDTICQSVKWWHHHYEYWDDLSADSVAIGCKWNASDNTPMCRKIGQKYRPFANAAEFMPHRDRWVKFKGNKGAGASRVRSYGEDGALFTSLLTYNEAFEKIVFEDGSPFGVCDGLT